MKLLWEAKEVLWFNSFEGCVNTCCHLCPEDPSTYKLTNNHLKIKTVKPLRIGPIRLCCCKEYSVNNIDLTNIDDVDMDGIPAPFLLQCLCCASGKEVIEIEAGAEGTLKIITAEGEGDAISGLIMNQVEESQQIERD